MQQGQQVASARSEILRRLQSEIDEVVALIGRPIGSPGHADARSQARGDARDGATGLPPAPFVANLADDRSPAGLS